MSSPIKTFHAGAMQVHVFPSKREASEAAAEAAAAILRGAIAGRGRARMVVSTGNSQLDFIDALVLARDLDWTRRRSVPSGRVCRYGGDAPGEFPAVAEDQAGRPRSAPRHALCER